MFLSAFVLPLLLASPQAPTAPRKADSAIGEVTDIAGGQLAVKTDAGDALSVAVDEKTSFLRAKPGATTLTDAAPVAVEDLSVGDRVLVRGRLAEDHRTFAARQVVVMTKGDIASKHEAEQADWRKRGVLGTVTAVDAAKGEITIQPRRGGATTALVLPTADRKIKFRRYAPDSVKFSDAKSSSLADVQVGDQLRALGNRSEDGAQFLAEQVVFGSFRTVVGDVVSVDEAKGLVTLKTEEAPGTLAVTVGNEARIRRLPPEMAVRLMARDAAGGAPGGGGAWSGGRGGPGGGAEGGGAAAPGGGGGAWGSGRGREGGGGEDILERLPPATLAELKAGSRILVSSTKGRDAAKLNAIAVVAGLEALRPPASAVGGRRGGGRGADIGLPADFMDLGMGVQ